MEPGLRAPNRLVLSPGRKVYLLMLKGPGKAEDLVNLNTLLLLEQTTSDRAKKHVLQASGHRKKNRMQNQNQ